MKMVTLGMRRDMVRACVRECKIWEMLARGKVGAWRAEKEQNLQRGPSGTSDMGTANKLLAMLNQLRMNFLSSITRSSSATWKNLESIHQFIHLGKGSSINDATQFWTIFDPLVAPPPLIMRLINRTLFMSSQNPWPPLYLRPWLHLWTTPN